MKKFFALTLAAAVFASALPARADEGLWLPCLISQRIEDMQAKGFKLDAEDIYSINQASLKDAVVLFGGGCTGELVSAEGLLFTNHHCGYSSIQKLSSVEHDYLRDGFWAMNRSLFWTADTIRNAPALWPIRWVPACPDRKSAASWA